MSRYGGISAINKSIDRESDFYANLSDYNKSSLENAGEGFLESIYGHGVTPATDDDFAYTATLADGTTVQLDNPVGKSYDKYKDLASKGLTGAGEDWYYRADDGSIHRDFGNFDDDRASFLYGTGLQIGGNRPEGIQGLNSLGENFSKGVDDRNVYTFTGGTGIGGTKFDPRAVASSPQQQQAQSQVRGLVKSRPSSPINTSSSPMSAGVETTSPFGGATQSSPIVNGNSGFSSLSTIGLQNK